LRRFIQVEPVLDFSALQPGRAATDAIFRIASEFKLDADFQAMVRQAGRIPMEDDELGSIKQNAGLNRRPAARLPISPSIRMTALQRARADRRCPTAAIRPGSGSLRRYRNRQRRRLTRISSGSSFRCYAFFLHGS
jgi:hypothetical protein